MVAPTPCSRLGGSLHTGKCSLLYYVQSHGQMGCSACMPCIHQGHVGPDVPKGLTLSSGNHSVLANETQSQRCHRKRGTELKRFRRGHRVLFCFVLQCPMQLAVSPGVASPLYPRPPPLVTHPPNYLQLGLKLGFELVELARFLLLTVQAALLVLCELAQEFLLP